ncbi:MULTISPECIES: IS110 family transposase [Roseobacteraceae]|uniref:Transposase IS116/IS110/IS902 family protein n=1 Tax=Pseudosulfitobacter pseudonitzschiae TaxID=1402135 RepID=A0A221K5S3_9RHOB|nr:MULTISPECIES: IS110 family transposase [Roseobacteraceae]ASM71056.1 transposase IS116/IS110/IS902 family protein [Pseudosulfitobacter pseudonitzschiae]ASM72023.1 transposase IS116/IS110/IS902 family protein [Pseudosulfitobacter pseudonitzschiae]ASM74362.1 transposase IS116/IS110/IS902 family protein [Pseudosulfitobacter pseudonitzschiae]
MKDTMIGVDLSKSVFQLHGTSMTGELKFRKKLSRQGFVRFMESHDPAVVVMEACGGANFWARELAGLGHDVKLVAPQYVRPFVKRQKNDAADAEAIVIAAQRPEMRFVEPKTEEQQARAVVFRARERLLYQRTELVNVVRSILYEHGLTFPTGFEQIGRIEATLRDPATVLSDIVRTECLDLIEQIAEKTTRINTKTQMARELAKDAETARRLQTMPGLGPITALAIETFAPPMETFKCGRSFAAWLGIVPRQHSSGGKARLGRISKAGQADIRRLLITGAMTRLNWLGRKRIQPGSWLAKMLDRKPRLLVAIALANKMARAIWAMLTKKEDYRDPAQVAIA